MKFSFAERYRLDIRWSKVSYITKGLAELKGCYLSGPVLAELDKVNEEDYIYLDFSAQYKAVVPAYYIVKLYWRGVEYRKDVILFKYARLENKFLNFVPKLKSDDFILIDTSNHVDDKHAMYLTYEAYLLNNNSELYMF